MSDQLTPPPAPPSFLTSLTQAAGQHLFTALAGALVTWGVIQSSQTTEIVDIGASLVTFGVGFAWHLYLSRKHVANGEARVAVAAATGRVG